MESSRAGKEGGTLFQPGVFIGKSTGKCKLPGINCCWSSQDMLQSPADTKPERKDLTQGQHNLLRKNCTSFLLGIAGE